MAVKKINVSGFRGLLAQFSLDLDGNSIIIYGRNGTGKSSITDAWEWFHKGDIEHLQREGARYDSYPHREASIGDTFVEVCFDNTNIDDCIKLEYNHNKKTKPTIIGNIDEFRELAPHPCHIRHRDLTQFVYFTKADKYDSLANLMGFEKQVEFQKSLRKTERKLLAKVKESNANLDEKKDKLLNHLDCNEIENEIILKKVNNRIKEWDIDLIEDTNDIKEINSIFRKKIEKDPSAEKLENFKSIKSILQNINIAEDTCEDLEAFKDNVINFLDEEIKISNIMLISLFENGLSVVKTLKEQKEDVNKCPLCGLKYKDDLEEHIEKELKDLTELKTMYNEIEEKREKLKDKILKSKETMMIINKNEEVISKFEEELEFVELKEIINEIISIINNYKKVLEQDTKDISIHNLSEIDPFHTNLDKKIKYLIEIKEQLLSKISEQIDRLNNDEKRKLLINDFEWIKDLSLYLDEYNNIKVTNKKLNENAQKYSQIVKDYVDQNTENVENKFNEISNNVAKFYNLIEKRTNGIENPSIRLIPDQDRAVILELEFFGQRTSPAYKYLSESQLNSFGLAIFLASAKKFNNNFKFLILDDIVNSFDAYKRPRVIELIKSEFSDFQLVILTHDSIWYKQITENLPSWKKLRFNRYVFGSGPITEKGKSELEHVRELLLDDKATTAGQILGPLMERQLQLILEFFKVQVPYNRDNIFTLRPLLQFLRSRIKNKLNRNHNLYIKINKLEKSTYFRNFCSHWKDPSSPVTCDEVLDVLDNWEEILNKVKCPCGNYLHYDGKTFSCKCGETRLNKA